MEKASLRSALRWNTILVISVLLSAFILPILPSSWGRLPAWIGFNLIFLSGVLSLEKKRLYVYFLSLIALVVGWISTLNDWTIIADISRALNVIFFFLVVFSLIRQIATARIVTAKVILEAISGYILLGILFAVVIAGITQQDPGAFNITQHGSGTEVPADILGQSMYFAFVTLATLGYGDIVPLEPYSRALTTFICISGQLYIAIIIAVLVGKYASRREHNYESVKEDEKDKSLP
ncbi:MAG: ion channel [Bacteroidetes bacterium]|nr:ion channel [Bacteroidota bacterium]